MSDGGWIVVVGGVALVLCAVDVVAHLWSRR